MMTAKEKAIELTSKFNDLVTNWDCYWDTDIPISDRIKDTKKCAIICVEEIQRVFHSIPLADQYSYLFQLEYWEEVKEEINKL